jgi:hypothetical protein
MDLMFYDYSKRDCLLPQGCKDLIDVLRLQQPKPAQERVPETILGKKSPPITQYVTLPSSVSVKKLIELAGKKPFCIIADLMDLGVFENIGGSVTFDIAARVLRCYGIAAALEG